MFDPYHRWLGIPKEQRPPTYYQILGIQPDEKDPEVIEEAAIRQTTHVRSYQIGAHSAECTRILNEIAQARATLLNPAKRKDYDARLTPPGSSTQNVSASKTPAPGNVDATDKHVTRREASPFAAIDAPEPFPRAAKNRVPVLAKPTARSGLALWLGIGLGGGALILAVVLAIAMSGPGGDSKKDGIAQVDGDKDKLPKKKQDADGKDKNKGLDKKVGPKDKVVEPPPARPGQFYSLRTVLSEPSNENGEVAAVACTADGSTIAWSHGRGVVMYDVGAKKATARPEQFLAGSRALAFSDDGEQFAAAGAGNKAYLWKTAGGQPLVLSHDSPVRVIVFSSTGKFILTASEEFDHAGKGRTSELHLWDAAKGTLLKKYDAHTQTITAAAFSANGKYVYSAARDKICKWDRSSGDLVRKYRENEPFGVSGFAPGAWHALGMSNEHPLLLWSLEDDNETRRFSSQKASPYVVACSRKPKLVALGVGNDVQVFDIAAAAELARLTGHTDWAWSVAMPADARFVVSGSKDGSVRLWENDFVPLFNGKDLAGWKSYLKGGGEDDGRTFLVENGNLVVSGKPDGYLYTTRSYRNYAIRLEWRYVRPAELVDDQAFKGDSGLLMHITGENKIWPDSVQVQWYHQEYGLIYLSPHVPKKNYTWNEAVMRKALNRVGEWNTTEVLSNEGAVKCRLNGVEISTGKCKLVEGPIGIQSEGAELHLRRIDIKELPGGKAAEADSGSPTSKSARRTDSAR